MNKTFKMTVLVSLLSLPTVTKLSADGNIVVIAMVALLYTGYRVGAWWATEAPETVLERLKKTDPEKLQKFCKACSFNKETNR